MTGTLRRSHVPARHAYAITQVCVHGARRVSHKGCYQHQIEQCSLDDASRPRSRREAEGQSPSKGMRVEAEALSLRMIREHDCAQRSV